MSVAARMRAIRLMEKMEKSSCAKKAEDGTLTYVDKHGDVLVEAKMTKKEEA